MELNYPINLSQNTSTDPEQMTQSIEGVAKIIDKYGPYITILAVFIIIFIIVVFAMVSFSNKLIKSSLEEKINLLNSQSKQNERLIEYITDDDKNTDDNSGEKRKRDLVGTYIDINLILKDAVRTASNELGAERVAIYVFHNGNKSIHGLPFFKVSCINEWSKNGSVAMKTKAYRSITHHSMPLYIISEIVENIYEHGEFYESSIKSKRINEDYLQAYLEYSDVDSMYALVIKDSNDNIAGFVVAEFKENKNFYDEQIRKPIQQILERTSNTVKPVVLNINGKYTLSHEEENSN